MPRHETVLQVFLASPGDVAEEREVLEQVVRELNTTWSQGLALRIEVLRWETHASPGIGDDAQAVVNRQIPDDYDVFLGIVWARIGTPTSRARSGTIEEFERALERHRRQPGSIEIMLYFKDAPLSPSLVDPKQLAEVHAFKERAQTEGILYQTFRDATEFEALTRLHLSRLAQSWQSGRSTSQPGNAPVQPVRDASALTSSSDDEEDEGYIDLVERAVESTAEVTASMTRINDAVVTVREYIETRSTALNELHRAGRSDDLKAFKRITNLAADDMQRFVAQVQLEIPVFGQHFDDSMKAFGRAVALIPELSSGEDRAAVAKALRQITIVLVNLRTSIAEMAVTSRGFRGAISRLPRMTTAFNRARKEVTSILDGLIDKFDGAVRLTEEAERTVEQVIEDLLDDSDDLSAG